MRWQEVERRIAAGEDERTEFKRQLDLSQVGRTVCAFANTQGGLLVLGVADDGEVTGLSASAEDARERVTSFLQTGCNAPVQADCGHRRTAAGTVLWIHVPRQRGFEPLRCGGRFWVRRDRATAEPSPAELQELFNAFGFVITEEQVLPAATVDDIDVAAFQAHLRRQGLDPQAPGATLEDDLRNRSVAREFDGALRPTLYGILAFGRQPQALPHTGSFWINCAAYGGEDRAADVILAGEARGRLDEQVQRALGWARGLGRFERYRGMRREDRYLLPIAALREALVNAAVHRDYAAIGATTLLEVFDDRVRVISPGGLPNHMTVDAVRASGVIRTRNEQMANAMLERGFMEKRGRGWQVMRGAMREFNDTEPEIDADRLSVAVTLRLKAL